MFVISKHLIRCQDFLFLLRALCDVMGSQQYTYWVACQRLVTEVFSPCALHIENHERWRSYTSVHWQLKPEVYSQQLGFSFPWFWLIHTIKWLNSVSHLRRYGRPDPLMERPFDISAKVRMASVRYLHTMRFLKEILAFLSHFPQLIDAFQRMKAMAQGNLVSAF